MISPYGRGKVKRDLEQGRLARSGGSRLKNVLSFSARGHRDHSEDEEEEKKKSKKQSRKAKGSKVDEKQRDYSDDEMESDRPKTRCEFFSPFFIVCWLILTGFCLYWFCSL